MRWFVALTVSTLLVTGCATPETTDTTAEATITSTSEPPGNGDPPQPQPEDPTGAIDADTTTTSEASADGTRESPIPVGASALVGDYEVSVVNYQPDATDTVLDYNEFNEPPLEDAVYSLITLSITYIGDESGDPWLDLIWSGVGGSDVSAESRECLTFPNDIFEAGELFGGGMVETNVCLTVTHTDVDSLILILEETFSFDSEPVFFALR